MEGASHRLLGQFEGRALHSLPVRVRARVRARVKARVRARARARVRVRVRRGAAYTLPRTSAR